MNNRSGAPGASGAATVIASPRLWLALVIGSLLLLGPAVPVWAHAVLLETTPADGAQLDSPPSEVRLVFNEPVGVSPGAVRVYDSSGRQVDRGDAAIGDRPEEVVATVQGLEPGSYVVTWRAASADGHPVQGAFVFQVGTGGPAVDESLIESLLGEGAETPLAAFGWLLRWVTYGAALAAIGAVIFSLYVAGSTYGRNIRLIKIAAVVGAVASLLQIPVFASETTGLGLSAVVSGPAMGQAFTSSVGLASMVRVVGFVLIWLTIGSPRRWWALSGVSALVVAELITGHTRTGEPVWLIWPADAVHVLAAGVWFGGLVALALSMGQARADDDVVDGARMVGGFSRLAVLTVLALVGAGLALAWAEVRAVRALTSTAYGWTLVAKTAITAGILGIGAYNNRVLVPAIAADGEKTAAWARLRRTVRIEVAGLLVVLGVTALLANLQPAAEAAGVAGEYSTYVPFGDGQLNLVVDPNRAGRNEIHFYVLTSGGLPALISGEAVLELRLPEQDIGPIVREPQVAGPGHYIHTGPELAIAGEWVITFRQRTSEFEEATADVPVVVNP